MNRTYRITPSRLLVLVAMAMLPLVAAAQQRTTYTYTVRDTAMRLDVWQPEVQRADKACVISLFGGGFVGGSRDNELQTRIARLLTARGYTVVSIDYRFGLRDSARVGAARSLGGVQDLFQWTIDIAAEDCAAACAWVVGHAGELRINPGRVVLTGSSAGAITVLQMDWCRANSLPQASALPRGWRPAAVVPYAGAIMSHGKPSYATPPAPTMLMHGTKDKIVAYKRFPHLLHHALYGPTVIYKRMKKQGYPVWIVRFEGIGHEVASFLPGSVDLFCGFVEQVFDGRVTTLDATMTDSLLKPTEWTKMTVIDLYK